MKIVNTKNAPAAIGPYSQAIISGGFVFCSGQIALDEEGNFVDGGVPEQTSRVLKNLFAVLEAAGCEKENVVKTTIYLVDINDFLEVNDVYGAFFGEHKPARATVAVAALPKGARVEIDCVAKLG